MRARIAASIVLAVGIALGTSACDYFAPQTTTKHYDASDGVSVTVGQIGVRNAILFSKNGELANLVVTLVNQGSSTVRLEIQHGTGSQAKNSFVTVPADGLVKLGSPGEEKVDLSGTNAKPGSLYPVFFQYGNETGVQALVPVLDVNWPEYKGLLPTPKPTTPLPTATPGATGIPTPTPTPTAAP
ncbi:MAG: hypothetical protein QOF36_230 [Microbacteriaceae bacterium]|nr:hypothetical protein [Microbacteriaceae bacterium]